MRELEAQLESQLGRESAIELGDTLDLFTVSLRASLHDELIGVYLVGSFALGVADIHSDVDFLVVLRDPVSAEQESELRRLHSSLPDSGAPWADHLEGSYVTITQLGRPPGGQELWLYVDNGSREPVWSTHDDTLVTRWVLRERGIRLLGPAADSLLDPVGAETLRAEAIEQARVRSAFLAADPEIFANAWGQTHVVTTFCRLWFTAATGEVAGKSDAVRWVMGHVSGRWNQLLERAVADRPHPWQRVHQPADPVLAEQMPEFVRECAATIVGLGDRPAQ